jgi:hypothetical protein
VLGKALEGVFDERENDCELSVLIKAKLSTEADSGIYDYLGLNKEKIVKEVEKYTGKKREYSIGAKTVKSVKPKAKAYTQMQGEDLVNFFTGIGNQAQPKQEDEDNNEGEVRYDMVPRNFNWDIGRERLVKQNILIGNYEGAIDAALKCGRTAEALVIAYSVDQNLFANTLKTFFTETTDNFITDVLKCLAYRDPVELINKYDLLKWKECIAIIYSMSSRDKRPELLRLLAQRLLSETEEDHKDKERSLISETYAPIICYILAEDFEHIAQIYASSLKHFVSGSLERKRTVVEYARRLVGIYEGLTVEVAECRDYNQLLREAMFIAVEAGEKAVAHLLCTRLPSNHRMLDYLAHSTPELEKYKASVSFKPTLLPAMQPKKPEKKTKVAEQPHPKKKGIFPPKEEESSKTSLAPPPPPGPKRKEEDTTGGFSPYSTAPKPA